MVKSFRLLAVAMGVVSLLCAVVASAQSSGVIALTTADLKWVDPVLPGSNVPVLEKGAKMAVLQGVPGGTGGPVVIRLKMPANFRIAPHWHSTDEAVTVISGTLWVGMGDTFSQDKSMAFPTASFGFIPAGHHHFAWTNEETMIDVHTQNPFDIIYVNSEDDPRTRT
jgi:hypothetical protein